MKKRNKILLIILSVILALLVALLSAFFILRHLGMRQFHEGDTNISTDAAEILDDTTVTVNGKKYTLNKNVINVLFIGIDRSKINEGRGYGKNGQADCIFLASFDSAKGDISIIPISRETMVDVNIYSPDGAYAGVEKMQICLAYSYGNSPEESSMNVIRSVKRILYGININSYVTVQMSAIQKLSDLIGGVEVTVLEEMKLDGKMVAVGQQLNLKGKAAFQYVHDRGGDLEANQRRMQRQKQFLTSLVNKVGNQMLKNYSLLIKLYGEMTPYFSSNISLSQITYLVSSCLTANLGSAIQYKNIEGTLTMGEKWAEFTADEQSAMSAVLDVFYDEVQ